MNETKPHPLGAMWERGKLNTLVRAEYERWLREVYMPAFKHAMIFGGPVVIPEPGEPRHAP